MGREAEARRSFERFRAAVQEELDSDPRNASLHLDLARASARLGDEPRARRFEQEAVALDSTLHFEHAQVLTLLGDEAAAIEELERAVETGFRNIIWIKIHPDFEPLYDEPRFQALLESRLTR